MEFDVNKIKEVICIALYPVTMLIYFICEGSTNNPPSFGEFWGYC